MGNQEQIREIIRYQHYLTRVSHEEVDLETAAIMWVEKYARAWRKLHRFTSETSH